MATCEPDPLCGAINDNSCPCTYTDSEWHGNDWVGEHGFAAELVEVYAWKARRSALLLRIAKLKRRRATDPMYCNRSDRNHMRAPGAARFKWPTVEMARHITECDTCSGLYKAAFGEAPSRDPDVLAYARHAR